MFFLNPFKPLEICEKILCKTKVNEQMACIYMNTWFEIIQLKGNKEIID